MMMAEQVGPTTGKELVGKLAVISGGTRGIGRAVAGRLVRAGARVVIAGRDQESLDAALGALNANGETARGVRADLATVEGVDALVAAATDWGGIDILVNNVGGAPVGNFLTLTDEQFLGAWNLKLLAGIRLTRAAVPQMAARGGGAIVNIIGLGGREPNAEATTIGTTNAAVRALTKGLSRDLAGKGIRINAVSPGRVRTERNIKLTQQAAEARGVTFEEVEAEGLNAVPTGRLVEPAEVAEVVLLMVSGLVPSMTGVEVVLDGGASHYI